MKIVISALVPMVMMSAAEFSAADHSRAHPVRDPAVGRLIRADLLAEGAGSGRRWSAGCLLRGC